MRVVALWLLAVVAVLTWSTSAMAVKRVVAKKEFPVKNKLVLSFFAGGGVPLREFEDETKGNHKKVGGDVSLEMEFFPAKYISLGGAVWGGIYDDKDFGEELQTNITTAGVFVRLLGRLGPYVYPYLKGGTGIAYVELSEPGVTYEAEHAPSYMAGAGFMIRFAEPISLNLQATYNYVETKGKDVPALDGRLTFDAEYVGVNVGLSLFFF